MEDVEVERPQFVGVERVSPVTGKPEKHFPFKRRLLRKGSALSAILLFLLIVLVAVFAVIVYRLAIRLAVYQDDPDGVAGRNAPLVASVTGALINLAAIIILNQVYRSIAVVLNDWENHRTETQYEDSLTFKIYLFQFVNSYASIAYIAFFKGKFVGSPYAWDKLFGYRLDACPAYGCMVDLAIQLSIIMIGKQAIGNAIELAAPVIARLRKQRTSPPGFNTTQHRRDFLLGNFEGLFSEYLEMILQYGFLVLFVAAFPLAPLFALLNNLLEIRLDAKKLVFNFRRPPAMRAEDIGVYASPASRATSHSYHRVVGEDYPGCDPNWHHVQRMSAHTQVLSPAS
jgi:hypothetical protein